MTSAMRALSESHAKRQKETLAEERWRDELFIKHREEEGRCNREHELKVAEIFARALAGGSKQQDASSAPVTSIGASLQTSPTQLSPERNYVSSHNMSPPLRSAVVGYYNHSPISLVSRGVVPDTPPAYQGQSPIVRNSGASSFEEGNYTFINQSFYPL